MVNFQGRVQAVRRCHLPHGEGRPGWRVVRDLAEAAGIELPPWTSHVEVLESLALLPVENGEGPVEGVPQGGGGRGRGPPAVHVLELEEPGAVQEGPQARVADLDHVTQSARLWAS